MAAVQRISGWAGAVLFPDDCRICESPLKNLSRVPVCTACLKSPRLLVADHACRICQTPFVSAYPLDEHDLCTVCRGRKISFDAAYSFGSYEGSLRELIRLFKYSRIESLSGPLGQFLLQALPPHRNFDVITPMPMHWFRRWQRGFNQSELLARMVAKRTRIPLAHTLRRVRMGKRQAGLGATARYANLQRAFALARKAPVEGKRILLIDDVLTTGATLAAAAAVLKAAGAREVCALTVARVVRRSGLPDFKANSVRAAKGSSGKSSREMRRGSTDYGDSGATS